MSKATIPISITKDSDNWFILADVHSKSRNKILIEKLIKMAMMSKPRERNLILLGDMIDFEFFMPKHPLYSKWIKINTGIEDYFIPKYDEEVDEFNEILDVLQKTFKRIIYILGNHEQKRIDEFLKSCPSQYHYYFNLRTSLRLRERGIMPVDYNDWLDIGDLSITHGMYCGARSAALHFLASGARDVLHAHEHQYKVTPMVSRGKTKHIYSFPCCTDLNPEYIGNKETNHSEGIGQVRFEKDGSFVIFINVLKENGNIVLQNGKII